ncbi:MAG: T9SS type A sorting domain-containing protein, partial [Bacteroidota bacterium]
KIVLAFQPGDSFDQFYASEPEIADFIKDVFFLSEEECLASSSVNNLFRIDKKQNDWKEVNLFRSFSSRYNTVLSNGTLALVDGLGLFILNDREFQFRSNLPNFDVLGLKSDPFNDSTLYLLTNWRLGGTELFKSTNNGLDWQSIYQSTFRASDVIIPAKDVLYVYSGSGSFDMDQSTDGGQTWKVIFSNEAIWIRSINFFDGDYGVMSLYDQIIITEDGGLNFKTYPQDFVENILFQSKRLLWATRFDGKGTHILKSKDGGQTWEDTFFLCDKVLRAKLDPFTGDIWYICTLGSVYVLRNEVSGFFHTPSATASFEIFPNPSNGLVNISFPRNQAIPADQLEIYDTAGRLIKKYDLDNYPLNSFDWSYLHSGAYIVRLIGEDFSESKKLLLHPQGSD